jgi:hypothetical protein
MIILVLFFSPFKATNIVIRNTLVCSLKILTTTQSFSLKLGYWNQITSSTMLALIPLIASLLSTPGLNRAYSPMV